MHEEPEVDSLWVTTTPVLTMSPRHEASVRRVQELARLPDNWDSYGGRAIQQRALESALSALRALASVELPLPFITPLADGGLQFEWAGEGSRALEVEIQPNGALEFLVDLGDEGKLEGAGSRPEEAKDLVELLMRK